MPWTPGQFKQRHNQGLSDEQAQQASAQANAILAKSGDEGMAIATANKNAMRREGTGKPGNRSSVKGMRRADKQKGTRGCA